MLRRRLMKKGIPEGAIDSVFSVSDKKKICFSKGNLQLVGANIWQFADNQWNYFGWSQSDNHRDLFGWGTGNNPNQTSSYNSDYDTFTDWGSNAISNGGNKAGLWRTLTKDELEYLLNTRTVNGGTGNGKSYTFGKKVNNVLGVVLYPDDYTGSTYDGRNWSAFESAGCVFLPAAGSRNGTSVSDIGSYGYYWLSTENGSEYAYTIRTYSYGTYVNDNEKRRGFSVRLVYDIK